MGTPSVRALKGPTRPINSQEDRAEVLAALACVDYVTIFDTPRVTDVVTTIRPHVYAKGGDYTVDSLDKGEVAALNAAGADIPPSFGARKSPRLRPSVKWRRDSLTGQTGRRITS